MDRTTRHAGPSAVFAPDSWLSASGESGAYGAKPLVRGQDLPLVISEVAHQYVAVSEVPQIGKRLADLGHSPDHQRLRRQSPIAVGEDWVGDPPRVGGVRADVNVAPDGGHAQRSAMSSAGRAVVLDLQGSLGGCETRRSDPAVPESGRTVDGGRC